MNKDQNLELEENIESKQNIELEENMNSEKIENIVGTNIDGNQDLLTDDIIADKNRIIEDGLDAELENNQNKQLDTLNDKNGSKYNENNENSNYEYENEEKSNEDKNTSDNKIRNKKLFINSLALFLISLFLTYGFVEKLLPVFYFAAAMGLYSLSEFTIFINVVFPTIVTGIPIIITNIIPLIIIGLSHVFKKKIFRFRFYILFMIVEILISSIMFYIKLVS
jgi:hypothetical protein